MKNSKVIVVLALTLFSAMSVISLAFAPQHDETRIVGCRWRINPEKPQYYCENYDCNMLGWCCNAQCQCEQAP